MSKNKHAIIDKISVTTDRMGERTIVFFDAVLAIAITLLVLELPIPEEAVFSIKQVEEVFLPFTAFFISFHVLGRLWLLHARTFSLAGFKSAASPVLHLLLMFWVILFPKTTELISTYPKSHIAILIYLGCTALLILTEIFILQYANKKLLTQYERRYNMPLNKNYLKDMIQTNKFENPEVIDLLKLYQHTSKLENISILVGGLCTIGSAYSLIINPIFSYFFFIIDFVLGYYLYQKATKHRLSLQDIWKKFE